MFENIDSVDNEEDSYDLTRADFSAILFSLTDMSRWLIIPELSVPVLVMAGMTKMTTTMTMKTTKTQCVADVLRQSLNGKYTTGVCLKLEFAQLVKCQLF
jgi:hypothetical protein